MNLRENRLEIRIEEFNYNERLYKYENQQVKMEILRNSLNECCICISIIPNPQNSSCNVLQKTTCGHFICKDCFWHMIECWSQHQTLNCPICRRVLFQSKRGF